MRYDIQDWKQDGKPIKKLKCPDCGVLGEIDDDQYHGRISTWCECGFHETINFAELEKNDH